MLGPQIVGWQRVCEINQYFRRPTLFTCVMEFRTPSASAVCVCVRLCECSCFWILFSTAAICIINNTSSVEVEDSRFVARSFGLWPTTGQSPAAAPFGRPYCSGSECFALVRRLLHAPRYEKLTESSLNRISVACSWSGCCLLRFLVGQFPCASPFLV